MAPYPGYTLARISDLIAFGQVNVKNYSAILLHFGTNDIPPTWDKHHKKHMVKSIDAVVQEYKSLVQLIRRDNSQAYIVLSAIIPRPIDHAKTKLRVEAINNKVQQWCCTQNRLIFQPTYKFFIKAGSPVLSYFSPSDRLHLRGAGIKRLQQCMQQALSEKNLAKANHWRRKPSSGAK